MDRNSVTGLILIAAIVIGFSIFNKPSAEDIEAAQRYNDSIAAVQADSLRLIEEANALTAQLDSTEKADAVIAAMEEERRLDSIKAANPELADSLNQIAAAKAEAAAEVELQAKRDEYGPFASSSSGKDDLIKVENEKLEILIAAKGGRIASVRLKEFVTYDSLPVFLWEQEQSGYGINLYNGGKKLNTSDFYFEPSGGDITLTGEDNAELRMRLKADNGSGYVEYVYGFKGNTYDLDFDINVVGLGDLLDNKNQSVDFFWYATPKTKEKSIETERRYCTIMWRPVDGDREYMWENSDDEEVLETDARWVAFKQDFFSAILTADEAFSKNSVLNTNKVASDTFLLNYRTTLSVPVKDASNASAGMSFYFGPNDYGILSDYEEGYEEVIDLGWGIFGYVNRWVVIPIFHVLEGMGLPYGLIIFLLTIIIKIILLPLMYRNYRSSAKMRVLKPEIDELNTKYPDKKDAMKKQQAQMELYRKTGVNPMAGCVPMLIQMPILYAMFRFFPSSIELRQESFLWADDLSGYDSVLDLGFNIPMYGDHISLFTLLMAISTWLYTRMNSSQMPTANQPGMPNMKIIMNFFPFMMILFFNNFSSALSYYYLIANLTSIGQMYLIKRYFIDENKLRAKIEENKKKPKKQSKFAARLAEIQKQQQQQRKGK